MNKSELIAAVATETGETKVAVAKVLESITKQVTATVAAGDAVALLGFGTFKPVQRAAREGKNPATGAKMKIPATVVPKFTVGAAFKSAVASGKKSKK